MSYVFPGKPSKTAPTPVDYKLEPQSDMTAVELVEILKVIRVGGQALIPSVFHGYDNTEELFGASLFRHFRALTQTARR